MSDLRSVISDGLGTVRTGIRTAVGTGTRRLAVLGVAGVVGLIVFVMVVGSNGWWPFVINGISDGSIYALAAIGLVLTFKTSGVFNFAIGAQAAASAYVFYTLHVSHGWAWPLAALATLIGVTIVSTLILERIGFWLQQAPAIMRVVATIGILVLLTALLTGIYGGETIAVEQFLPINSFTVGGVNVGANQVIVTVLALGATIGLYLFFKNSRWGLAMQAVVDDAGLLSLLAVSPALVRRYAWAIGSAFVSMSGILVAPVLGLNVSYMILLYITAFGAAALGSFTSLPITFAAALGIGIFMNILGYETSTTTNNTIAVLYLQIPFLAVVAALLLLPARNFIQRGVRQVRRLPPVRTFPKESVTISMAIAVVVGLFVPVIAGESRLNQYTTGLGFAIVLAALGLVLWTSGQISLCHMAFAAVGASTFAHAQASGWPWLLALLAGGLVAIPVGVIVAIPSFRLSGVYLAAATFGFGLLFQNMMYSSNWMFGQPLNLPITRPKFLGVDMTSDKGYYYVALAVTAVCFAVIVLVRRSRLGRLLRGLGDSPAAMEAHGVDTRVTRLYVFCISAVLAAVGGAVIAGTTFSASGSTTGPFSYFNSLVLLAVLVFCGRQPLLSPVIAAFVFAVLKIYSPFDDPTVVKYQGVGFGLLAILVAVAPGIRGFRMTKRLQAREHAGPVASRKELVPA